MTHRAHTPPTATATAESTEIHIKNMVCDRCIAAVRGCFEAQGLHPLDVELGLVRLTSPIDDDTLQRLRGKLEELGFALLDTPNQRLAGQIKDTIVQLVHYSGECPRTNLSEYLSARLGRDYSTLSKVFSETAGITIEKYAILQKTERAKELLAYGELTLNEIADRLGYSSAAYLSAQFKSVTGMTPGDFRKRGAQTRKPLDKV